MNTDIVKQTQVSKLDHSFVTTPEFFRLPKSPARCPYSGLSRSALNELILGPHPLVRSVVVRKRGSVRGIRLIDYSSLMRYLHQLGEQEGTSQLIAKEVCS